MLEDLKELNLIQLHICTLTHLHKIMYHLLRISMKTQNHPKRHGNERNLPASFMIKDVSTDSDYMDPREYGYLT